MSQSADGDCWRMTALDLRGAIGKKEISPVEVVEASLRRLEATESEINAFTHVSHELARASARKAERKVLKGERLGLLHGIPVSVKDLIAVENLPCEFGSKSMIGNISSEDAPSVERIKAQGACIIGKTTTSEFGCKAVGDSPLSGITRNPWNLKKNGRWLQQRVGSECSGWRHTNCSGDRRRRINAYTLSFLRNVWHQTAVRQDSDVATGCSTYARAYRYYCANRPRCGASVDGNGRLRSARSVYRRRVRP